jgi:hypothetical protein
MSDQVEVAGKYVTGNRNIPLNVDSNGKLNVNLSGSNPENPVTDGSGTITLGGTAQALFSSAIPPTGFAVYNPDASYDLWINDGGTAVVNGAGSIRIVANGGGYETPLTYKPIGPVSIISATTGAKFTAKYW